MKIARPLMAMLFESLLDGMTWTWTSTVRRESDTYTLWSKIIWPLPRQSIQSNPNGLRQQCLQAQTHFAMHVWLRHTASPLQKEQ